MKRHVHKFCVLLLVFSSFLSMGLVIPAARGLWPLEWPQELEPLRAKSRSVDIATGIRQAIFEIPIPDRATFEKVWPAMLKLRTPGSPITLYRAEASPPRAWGSLLSNQNAAVRIYTSSYDFTFEPLDHAQARLKFGQPRPRPTVGKTLHVGAPWPKTLLGPKGELPEYVVAEKNKDGVLEWVAADWEADKKEDKFRGLYHRARIDLELVVDGKTIDLATLKFPEDAQILDKRSENQK